MTLPDTGTGYHGAVTMKRKVNSARCLALLIPVGVLPACGSSGQPGEPAEGGSPTRIVFVAGPPSHGPGEHEYNAGSVLLATMLKETSGVVTEVVRGGWPEDVSVFDQAQAIVFYTDGNLGHPLIAGDHFAELTPHLARGVGFVCLHWSVHYPPDFLGSIVDVLGGQYLDGYSINPVWQASYDSLPSHPILQGVDPFVLQDEWYYHMRFTDDAAARLTPLLDAVPPEETRTTEATAMHAGEPEITAWAFERPAGGRSFGYTGGHYHRNWGDPHPRRLVVNAILWAAGREVPSGGATVDMDPALLDENLDPK
jgi:type 1 glutamine amidotransferase